MKIHENETLINRNKMRIEELTIQMEGSQEIKEQWKEQNKIRQEIQQQNEMLKLENNKLQNHISNYAQSLKEKSKELEAMVNVYPAAGLLNYVPRDAEVYLIDPKPVDVHSMRQIHIIRKGASEGVQELRSLLTP